MKKNSFLILLILISFISCKKDKENPSDQNSNFLFKISFENNWICDECQDALVFLNNSSGELIAEKFASGNTSLIFDKPTGFSEEFFSLSIIRSSTDSTVIINTFDEIAVGAEWKLNGGNRVKRIPRIERNITIENIPDHEGYVFSSYASTTMSNSGTLERDFNFWKHDESNDVYIGLKNTNGHLKYTFLENVVDQSTIDLSNMTEEDNSQNIDFPFGMSISQFDLRGYSNSSSYNSNSVMLYFLSSIKGIQTVFKPELFPLISARYYFVNDGDLYRSKEISTFGYIPAAYESFEGEINVTMLHQSSFHLEYTGNYDYMRATYSIPLESGYSSWSHFAPLGKSSYSLPDFPESTYLYFPKNEIDSLEISIVRTTEYNTFSGYQEYINAYSKSNHINTNTEIRTNRFFSENKKQSKNFMERARFQDEYNF